MIGTHHSTQSMTTKAPPPAVETCGDCGNVSDDADTHGMRTCHERHTKDGKEWPTYTANPFAVDCSMKRPKAKEPTTKRPASCCGCYFHQPSHGIVCGNPEDCTKFGLWVSHTDFTNS